MRNRLAIQVIVLLVACGTVGVAQEKAATCPMHKQHMEKEKEATGGDHNHLSEVNKRGDHVMGFSQEAATHHFRMTGDGGYIQVETNDSNDTTTRDQIREHLAIIARAFAKGDFEMPMLIHSQVPPGVPTMKRLASEIAYTFEETERGGRVRISTSNSEALSAIHDFLKFQIQDHQTGDPLTVAN